MSDAKVYSKKQLQKMTAEELDAILIGELSYKAEGAAAIKSKKDKYEQILKLQKAPAEKPEEKPEFSKEQIADYITMCQVIGDPDLDSPLCQACKKESALKKQKKGGFFLKQFDYCSSLAKAAEATATEKKSKKTGGQRTIFGHQAGSQSATLDSVFAREEGTTIEAAALAAEVPIGRAKRHLKHLLNEGGRTGKSLEKKVIDAEKNIFQVVFAVEVIAEDVKKVA